MISFRKKDDAAMRIILSSSKKKKKGLKTFMIKQSEFKVDKNVKSDEYDSLSDPYMSKNFHRNNYSSTKKA